MPKLWISSLASSIKVVWMDAACLGVCNIDSDEKQATHTLPQEQELELVRSDQSNTGFKGVCRQPCGRFYVRYRGSPVGWYRTVEEAARAYAAAVLKHTSPRCTALIKAPNHTTDAESEANGVELSASALRQAEEEGLQIIRSAISKTGFMGVCKVSWSVSKFYVRCCGVEIGYFSTLDEAVLAYARARKQIDDDARANKRGHLHGCRVDAEAAATSSVGDATASSVPAPTKEEGGSSQTPALPGPPEDPNVSALRASFLQQASEEGLELVRAETASGYKGVYCVRGRYLAQVWRDGERIQFGATATAEEGALALARYYRYARRPSRPRKGYFGRPPPAVPSASPLLTAGQQGSGAALQPHVASDGGISAALGTCGGTDSAMADHHGGGPCVTTHPSADAALHEAEMEGLQLVRSEHSNTGFKGVCRQSFRFGEEARYYVRCRGKAVGVYETAEEGALAYARQPLQDAPAADTSDQPVAAHTEAHREAAEEAAEEGLAEELPARRSRMAPSGPGTYVSLSYDRKILRRKVRVYWEAERAWFVGQVRQFDLVSDMHWVVYVDGDVRDHCLNSPDTIWEFVDDETPPLEAAQEERVLAFEEMEALEVDVELDTKGSAHSEAVGMHAAPSACGNQTGEMDREGMDELCEALDSAGGSPSLLRGWKAFRHALSNGRSYFSYFDPDGRRFRSRIEVVRHLGLKPAVKRPRERDVASAYAAGGEPHAPGRKRGGGTYLQCSRPPPGSASRSGQAMLPRLSVPSLPSSACSGCAGGVHVLCACGEPAELHHSSRWFCRRAPQDGGCGFDQCAPPVPRTPLCDCGARAAWEPLAECFRCSAPISRGGCGFEEELTPEPQPPSRIDTSALEVEHGRQMAALFTSAAYHELAAPHGSPCPLE